MFSYNCSSEHGINKELFVMTVIEYGNDDQYLSISAISTLNPPVLSYDAAGRSGSPNKHRIIIDVFMFTPPFRQCLPELALQHLNSDI